MAKNKLAAKWIDELEKKRSFLHAQIKEIDKKIHFLNNVSTSCKCRDCQNTVIEKKTPKKKTTIDNEYFKS